MAFDGVIGPAGFLLFIVVFNQIQHGTWLAGKVTLAIRVWKINGTREYEQGKDKGKDSAACTIHVDEFLNDAKLS
jgi:hypothetical protein